MAQILKYKTKNQIFSDFIYLCMAALGAFNVKGWNIRQLNQVYKINILNPTIFISLINNSQRGREYVENGKYSDGYRKKYSTKEEITIRFSALRREEQKDTTETYNAIDVLKVLKKYIQSDKGIKVLSKLGYAQYKSENVQEQTFTNDSDNFQFMPYFQCTFVYTDEWTEEINKIDKVQYKIYKI